jgi:hypothetical protein
MNWLIRGILAAIGLLGIALIATGNPSMVPPTPSARLGIEMDVKPIEGKAGQFLVSWTVTDLEITRSSPSRS